MMWVFAILMLVFLFLLLDLLHACVTSREREPVVCTIIVFICGFISSFDFSS